MINKYIITIDGPSGSGKSATAEMVASRLGFAVLHTGKIYRFFAKIISEQHADISNIQLLAEILGKVREINYCQKLDSEEIGKIASSISQIKEVRAIADQFQFDFIKNNPASVIEGRDIGTVICPDAGLKIFLKSSSYERAKRRSLQLGEDGNLSAILAKVEARDKQDSTRILSPLKPADDAVIIDNTDISLLQVVDIICSLYKERIS